MFRRKSVALSKKRHAEDVRQILVRFNPEARMGMDIPKRFKSRRRKSRVAVCIEGV